MRLDEETARMAYLGPHADATTEGDAVKMRETTRDTAPHGYGNVKRIRQRCGRLATRSASRGNFLVALLHASATGLSSLIGSGLLILIGVHSLAQELTQTPEARAHKVDRTNIAVIVNEADPLSVLVADYYVRARHIPSANIVRVRFAPHSPDMSVDEFRRVKSLVDAAIPIGVQAYALAWTTPYRVGCMSITSAFAFGFDTAYCARGCSATKLSAYFNFADSLAAPRIRPAMMLAGRSFAAVRALIDRGVDSDGAFPHGTAYLLLTTDKARDSRVPIYPMAKRVAAGLVDVQILKQDALIDRNDIMFYFTGLAWVGGLDTLRFLPGAIADHLTSYGGMLTDSSQMSALRWLEAGATGSYGTVVEPCNFPQKFAHPAIVIGRYVSGDTLIEAYWKSVAWPGQGVFVGEPLAAPFRAKR